MDRPSRRSILASLGAVLTGFAGCSNADTPTTISDATTTTEPTARPTTPGDVSTTGETTKSSRDLPTTGQPGDVEAFDEVLPALLKQWEIPGATVAVMDDERLAFTRGYGTVGPDSDEPVRPNAYFRIGSLSKPITAVATLDLVEKGKLALSDRAFEIRSDLLPEEGPADPRVEEITVRQLLSHTAGWSNATVGFDPVFAPIQVAEAQGSKAPASAEVTVEFMLTQDLGYDPGTDFQYANVGYCVLGRIIEGVTGEDYETHVREAVLEPLGADELAIGATRKENLRKGEVRYLSHATVQSPFPGEGAVPRPYGAGVLGEALDADGGWVGSAPDLLRFVRGVDGLDGAPDILEAETRETMLARPDVSHWEGTDQYYGLGWFVDRPGDGTVLWHNGSLPGSYAFLAHDRNESLTLLALFNGRSPDQVFGQFNVAAQRTLLRAMGEVDSWPDRDRFDGAV
ncbi:serine hydrolase domain-containing protein [Halorhabdus rudnickae]|uniref:serine hydrolase domain-containing protein n=1 Tax=Halorhabdus rudnickae TaxID=1775544 RepID=UPI0014382A01|nr:serine hydrolase domain-containing protein [Halorhabdus rudnickae]